MGTACKNVGNIAILPGNWRTTVEYLAGPPLFLCRSQGASALGGHLILPKRQSRPLSSRFHYLWLSPLCLALLAGCGGPRVEPEVVWGRQGVQDGDFSKPRAIAIDKQDRLYIVDFTARIQVFDRDGQHLGLTWTTPDYRNGRPSGLAIDRDGNLIVCDSHYNCLRIYSIADGKAVELRKIGGEPGK